MALLPDDSKSCDPQLLLDPPDPGWGVEDLAHYARAQEQAIVAGDRSLTACYWRLGRALELARKQFAHRQWGRFLEELGIDKSRASKARAIHGTFETESAVAELTVQEAYRRRPRKPRVVAVAKQVSVPTANNLTAFLLDVCKQSDFCAGDVGDAAPEQAAEIVLTIDDAITELQKLRAIFQRRLGA